MQRGSGSRLDIRVELGRKEEYKFVAPRLIEFSLPPFWAPQQRVLPGRPSLGSGNGPSKAAARLSCRVSSMLPSERMFEWALARCLILARSDAKCFASFESVACGGGYDCVRRK